MSTSEGTQWAARGSWKGRALVLVVLSENQAPAWLEPVPEWERNSKLHFPKSRFEMTG